MEIDVSQEIEDILQDYSGKVIEKLNEVVDEQAKETVKELKQTSPKRKGKYARGWTVKKTKDISGGVNAVVHNKRYYRLTHLLENGHALRGGTKRARAYPHIAQVEEKTKTEFVKKVRVKIESI
jgi:bacteriophage protein of unknown function (DUF646)|uniref:Putative tail component n=1 Tax=Siphoviridae sp. ctGz830 TaxID=2827825 RepID=A0A8S5TB19_9CAUD|nr:MAG TPA: putative tail component [Siphoviridae sp. ctGz830]